MIIYYNEYSKVIFKKIKFIKNFVKNYFEKIFTEIIK